MAQLGPHLYNEGDPDKIVEPATEIFEIDDFTSPSDWEKFVSQVEHLIREWGMNDSYLSREGRRMTLADGKSPNYKPCSWRTKTASLIFYGFEFAITWHYRITHDNQPEVAHGMEETESKDGYPDALRDMFNSANDFESRGHPLHYFYGLNQFVTFGPSDKEKEDIDNETRSKMALSTITVAVHNTRCQVPFFVQVMERNKFMYTGVFVGGNVRTDFQMIVLSRKPSHVTYLSGLLSMFKGKITTGSIVDVPSVRVTVRTTFHLEDWTCHAWSQAPPDVDSIFTYTDSGGFFGDLSVIPLGTMVDPIRRLVLFSTWMDLQEEIITDSDIHSDLDPLEAPHWAVEVEYENKISGLMLEHLQSFLYLSQRKETLRMVLGDILEVRPDADDVNLEKIPNVFDRLTGASPTYRTIPDILQSPGGSRRKVNVDGPIKSKYLAKILEFLFPDSIGGSSFQYPKEFSRSRELADVGGISIKSAPINGLAWRLTLALSHCMQFLGGIKAVAHLMHEFVLEMRYRWENAILLPGLPEGAPDHAYSLLHQKLQMVNCCIEKKRQRECTGSTVQTKMDVDDDDVVKKQASDNEEDEFFDCDDDEEGDDNRAARPSKELPVWNRDPVGRLSRLRNAKLLEHDDFLYVPQCQDPTPMTEDMLEEHAEMLLQLGLTPEGAEIRAKMQSASLLSDMESFKAANPGAILADFVRWHSPRDWEEEHGSKTKAGKLSSRMMAVGNIWQETWESAKPVPARRQKRLFDDTREAEKVIQFLAQLSPGEATSLLMPTFLHACYVRLMQESVHIENINGGVEMAKDCVQKISKISRIQCLAEVSHYKNTESEFNEGFYDDLEVRENLIHDAIALLQILEIKVSVSFSLHAKFLKSSKPVEDYEKRDEWSVVDHQLRDVVSKLNSQQQVIILGGSRGPVGQIICRMFYNAQRASCNVIENEEHSDTIDLTGKDYRTIFPAPVSKEYILRTFTPRPYPYSAPTPQRMFMRIDKNEFRVAGAFSIDKQFL